jgi:hypothetical protein
MVTGKPENVGRVAVIPDTLEGRLRKQPLNRPFTLPRQYITYVI